MTGSPEKSGVAFWATVVVIVVLVLYPLSFGPACWAYGPHSLIPHPVFSAFYRPMIWACDEAPEPIRKIALWYFWFGMPESK